MSRSKLSNDKTLAAARQRRQSAYRLRQELGDFRERFNLTLKQTIWAVSSVLRDLLSEQVEHEEIELFGAPPQPTDCAKCLEAKQ